MPIGHGNGSGASGGQASAQRRRRAIDYSVSAGSGTAHRPIGQGIAARYAWRGRRDADDVRDAMKNAAENATMKNGDATRAVSRRGGKGFNGNGGERSRAAVARNEQSRQGRQGMQHKPDMLDLAGSGPR
ncbi:conserved hypothetical protein [Paraburkholderia piptadeniae]|uniref:Uncharacterized protein n=1 Tax=Paraburkholderia piptadeniae TaxID=1701573 RepID=A0A1N7S6A4_9BURK|nr:conserved hypothetical protein [Paraburkholderia piptadeniae]